jgi:signal transduction histidine kinase
MHTKEITVYYALIITAVLAAIIIAFYIYSAIYQAKRIHRLLLDNMKMDINLIEQERLRIAHDLHDDLGSLLSLAILQLETYDETKDEDNITMAKENMVNVSLQLNNIANNLSPTSIKEYGLQYAIQKFIDPLKKIINLSVQFNYYLLHQPPVFISIHLYRIIQELVNNTIKHAGAKKIQITLRQKKQNSYLYYSDDGLGFDVPDITSKKSGIGLRSIQSRCLLLQGTMSCNSSPAGTHYLIIIPLKTSYE